MIVRPETDRFQARLDGFGEVPGLHESHSQSVPAIKEIRLDPDAFAKFFGGSLQIPEGEVSGGLVKNPVDRLVHQV